MGWHSQVSIIFEMMLQVQQILSGMNWTFVMDGREMSKMFCLKLPIMGNMSFLSKLVIANHGNHGQYVFSKQTCFSQDCQIQVQHAS